MMEDNSKLFVFDKKEVVLIFVFVVVIAVTAFTLGVRLGKRLSLKEDGYTKEDVAQVNLKSVDEEYVESVVENQPANVEEALSEGEGQMGESAQDIEARLRAEMEKLASGELEPGGAQVDAAPAGDQTGQAAASPQDQAIENTDDLYEAGQDVRGKFTIQLYANQSKAAAQDFADAFIVKGYDVIINEAQIPGKGNWYRVSIGVFDNIEQAKDYLQKEQRLFQGEDYIIQQL